jgi:dihydrofolate reductase
MTVSLIVAVAANGVIGRKGGLPWHLPADLKRFKQLTMGHHLILGRGTWETLDRLLPGRTFVVVTRRDGYDAPGALVVPTVEAGLEIARKARDPEPFVAGGSAIYRAALERDLVDRIHLTRIHRDYEGDTRFPDWDEGRWDLVARESHPEDPEKDRPAFDFLTYDRLRGAV